MLNVTLAAPQRHQSLTVFPLVTREAVELRYELLVDACLVGTLEIKEVGSGSVPELRAINHAGTDILILDGEQLVGARQNRMTNRSILLPAGRQTTIPVSCMEQGRWHLTSESFAPTGFNSPAKVRRKARESEAEYAILGMPAPPEALAHAQSDIWRSIVEHSAALGAHSATGALNDLSDQRLGDLTTWERYFPAVEGQVGLLAFLGRRPLGTDVIGGRTLYGRLHPRLLRRYLMDALEEPAVRDELESGAAQQFLEADHAAQRVASPTVGKGSYSVLAGAVIGGDLREGERLVHLAAFPTRAEDRGPVTPPRRESRSPRRAGGGGGGRTRRTPRVPGRSGSGSSGSSPVGSQTAHRGTWTSRGLGLVNPRDRYSPRAGCEVRRPPLHR